MRCYHVREAARALDLMQAGNVTEDDDMLSRAGSAFHDASSALIQLGHVSRESLSEIAVLALRYEQLTGAANENPLVIAILETLVNGEIGNGLGSHTNRPTGPLRVLESPPQRGTES